MYLQSTFISDLMDELAKILEAKLKHATLKHPQKIEAVDGPLKRMLRLNTTEQWTNWHKYVPLATFIHNTSYHTSIGVVHQPCCVAANQLNHLNGLAI